MAHKHATEPKMLHELFESKPARAGAAATIALLAAVTLSACGPDAGAKPSSTPTAVETTTPTPEAPPYPELATMYKESPDAFLTRPIDQRGAFCDDLEKNTISLVELNDVYADISGNDYDRVEAPATIDDDEQKIVSGVVGMHRLASIQKDPALAIKGESCNYLDPVNSPIFAAQRKAIEAGGFGGTIEGAANHNQLLGQEATSWEAPVSGVDANGVATREQVINTKDSSGATYTGDYLFVPATDHSKPRYVAAPLS